MKKVFSLYTSVHVSAYICLEVSVRCRGDVQQADCAEKLMIGMCRFGGRETFALAVSLIYG
jgi:hypothetical protein